MRLRAENLHAHYGLSHILHGVDIEIGTGETVCLLGRNGVGKSTTMKALMGLVRPSEGRIWIDDRMIAGEAPHRIARLGLGYVPEERRIFPTISVRENLLMGRKKPAAPNTAEWTMARVFECFPRLEERAGQRAGTLSGGEQQMLTIGRTLMGNPSIVLVDEPTEGLAPMIVERVEHVLVQMQTSGAGVLLVEQTIETALALSSRTYVMAKGRIVFSGTTAQFRDDPAIRKTYLEV